MTDTACRLCGDTRQHPISMNGATLVGCAGCGVIRRDPLPSAEELHRLYQQADASTGRGQGAGHQSLPAQWKSWLLAQLARAPTRPLLLRLATRVALHPMAAHFRGIPSCRTPGAIVDVGCGNGLTLTVLRDVGWRPLGIELDPRAPTSHAAEIPIVVGDLSTIAIPPESADVVRAWHVLEHLPDPLEALRHMRAWLKPGGELILGVPNIRSAARAWFGHRWSGWQSPYHLYHFAPRTIRALVTRAGFAQVRVRQASVGTTLDSLMTFQGAWGRRIATHPLARVLSIYVDLGLDLCGVGDGLEIRARR